MVRVQVMSDNTLFVQWLIAYVLLHPYVNLMAAAVSLPPRGTNVDSPSGARSDNASTECDQHAEDFTEHMLCSTDITNSTSPGAPQSVHVDTPTPGTYQATHPFFIWQQSNFLESKALEHYTNWSKGAHERRLTAQNGSEIDETRLFVIEYLGWTDFDCGADQQRCGCPLDSNVLNEIIVAIPDDAIKARQVYFSMKMLHWANQLVCTVLIAGNSAELAMLSKSGEFAEIFFLKQDPGAEAECAKQNAAASALVGAAIVLGIAIASEAVGPLLVAGSIPTVVRLARNTMNNVIIPAEMTVRVAAMNIRRILPFLARSNVALRTSAQFDKALKLTKSDLIKYEKFSKMYGNVWDKYLSNLAFLSGYNAYQNTVEDGGRCGLALPQDDRVSNTATAMTDISAYMKPMVALLTARMALINEGQAPPKEDPQDAPSEMSFHLRRLFGQFVPEERILDVVGGTPEVADAMEQFITDRLVEKAWRTKPCYIHCAPNPGEHLNVCSPTVMAGTGSISFCPTSGTACQAACWRGGPDMTNEPLYGSEDPRISGQNWNANLTDVLHGSYWDWHNNMSTYLTDYAKRSQMSSIDDLANAGGIRLPVCVSDYWELQDYTEVGPHLKHNHGQSFPCSCGNSWGDNTQEFYATDDKWYYLESHHGFGALGEYVEMCRSQLQKPFGRHAAKFAVDICYVTARTYPENHQNVQGYHEPSRTDEGRQVCGDIVEVVNRMRHEGRTEGEINSEVCGIVNVNRGETHEKGDHEGFQRVLHEIQDKCD